jgi:hypothetical protein
LVLNQAVEMGAMLRSVAFSSRPRWVRLLILLGCLVPAVTSCSVDPVTNNNNGNCNAVGGGNGVNCVAPPSDAQVSSDSGSGSADSGGSTPTANPTVNDSAVASQDPATTRPSPTVRKALPVMAPITNQAGWNMEWHGQDIIGPQGVLVRQTNPNSGPATGTGNSYDLQYVPGTGWNSPLNYIYYWTENYQPGPATIAGLLNGNFSGTNPSGMLANVGDEIFDEMSADDLNIVFCLQVVKVDQSGVLVNMWIWNST